MEPKEMTMKDILKDVLKMLNDIKIPMSEIETIGIPVGRAINGIQICVNAIEKAEQEEAQKAQEAQPVIELVPEPAEEGNDAQ